MWQVVLDLGIPNARLVPWTMPHVQWISLHLGSWKVCGGGVWRFPRTSWCGGFLQWWVSPTTMGFPTKNDHFGVFWGYHHLRKHPCHDLWILSLPQPLPSARLSNDGHYALCQASSIVLLHLATLCARSQSGVAEQKHPHQEHQAGTKDFLANFCMEYMLMTCWVRMKRKSRICLLPVAWHEMTSILSIQHSKCLAIEMYSASTLRNIAFIFLYCGQALSGNTQHAISIVPFNWLSLWRLRPQPLNHLFSPTLAPRAVRFAMQEEDGHLQLAWDFSQNHAFMAVYWTWKWNG